MALRMLTEKVTGLVANQYRAALGSRLAETGKEHKDDTPEGGGGPVPPGTRAGGGGPALSFDDVFDTDIELLSGLVDRGPREGGAPSYFTYDSFLFGVDKGKHPRHSLIARD